MAKKVAIPTFGYPGSKARLARRICALLPPSGRRFIDIFSGRGNVTWAAMALLNYQEYWINDIQTNPFFAGIKLLPMFLPFPKPSKRMYKVMKARNAAAGKLMVFGQPAALFEQFLSFSGGTYTKAGPRKLKARGGSTLEGFFRRAREAHRLLRSHNHKLTDWDYRKVLAECKPDDVVYLDVPYKGANVKAYDDKKIDFPGLVKSLLDAPFKWMFSEYPNRIYDPLTEKFGPPLKIPVQRVMTNTNQVGRKTVIECLWKNF